MKFDTVRRFAWRTLLLCTVASVAAFVFASVSAWRANSYDYAAVVAKFKRIGVAIQIYRKEHGYKPVAKRKNYLDAGLPETLLTLLEPGHRWTVSAEDLKAPSTPRWAGMVTHFNTLYLDSKRESKFYSLLGESFPIVADYNSNSNELLNDPRRTKQVVVLSLNGRVDIETASTQNTAELFTKRGKK